MKKQNRIKLLTLLSCLFYCCCTDTLIQEINTTTSTNSDILSRAKLIMHHKTRKLFVQYQYMIDTQ